jgi:hypothetical protein
MEYASTWAHIKLGSPSNGKFLDELIEVRSRYRNHSFAEFCWLEKGRAAQQPT